VQKYLVCIDPNLGRVPKAGIFQLIHKYSSMFDIYFITINKFITYLTKTGKVNFQKRLFTGGGNSFRDLRRIYIGPCT